MRSRLRAVLVLVLTIGLLAFFFNTMVLALGINILASVVGG